ncbi:MAG: competence protein [Alphaproteobacteria bacterium]|nr:competence protein [Alphaproteobacteria bacterium]
MQFALLNNERVSAAPKLKGLCPGCSQPVTAKCGTQRVWHWAHSSKKPCSDKWWEPETQWHRDWKNNFPVEWQEFVQHDQLGEKHIADVRTNHGLVVEFQHSHLDPQERTTRERFYRNMVWVVDGTRLKRDYQRFFKGKSAFRTTNIKGFFFVAYPEECFPANWLQSSVPVFFDFRGVSPSNPPDMTRELLWYLLPGRAEGNAVVCALSRKDFVQVSSGEPKLFQETHVAVNNFAQHIRHQRAVEAANAQRRYYQSLMPRRRQRRF